MIPNNVLTYCKERWGEKLPLDSDTDLRLPAKEAWQGSEHDLQKTFFRWLSDCMIANSEFELWLSHAIPNGGNRSRTEAARFVAEGVKSGIPDTFFPFPNKFYAGLYIEFKRADNGPTKDQRAMILMLRNRGYDVKVVNDLATAKRVFDEYMKQL